MRHCIRTTIHPSQDVVRECAGHQLESGKLFFVERVLSMGCLHAAYEYNIYYWAESNTWEADVVSPYGWHDVEEAELKQLIEECGIGDSRL